MPAWWTVWSVFVLLSLLFFVPKAQAGKYCREFVEGGLASAETQEDAIIAAQEWWSSRAATLGRGYESWDNSKDRALECSKDDSGMFRCQAFGRPCLPEGTLRDNLPKIDM